VSSPPLTVGIVGGGQLGRMLALAGIPLGVRCVCVEPADVAPAAVAADVIRADYGDHAALGELARRCDVVTVELEHVDVDALGWLSERLTVHPAPQIVATVQDRLLEKQALRRAGVATATFAEPSACPTGYPGGTVVKRRLGGFDGRGQLRYDGSADALAAADELGGPCIVEEVVPFDRELSIVAARSVDGSVACYPVVENRHVDGILRETIAPAVAADQATAEELVRNLLSSWGYVGTIGVELFEVDGALLANEVAPRVHNSGHWTIEGSATSQFEQHVRAICGLPLGDVSTVGPSGMVNLLGGWPDPASVLALPHAHLHLYGKAPRPQRKVGHVTVVAPTVGQRDTTMAAVRVLMDVRRSSSSEDAVSAPPCPGGC
jgi:5-(carboxyamino)imidazole ribonucleotide synthase